MYRDFEAPAAKGSFILPWVRLHCVRDYYSMAALLICHPNVHLTINLTPVLLRQIEAYVEGGCTRPGARSYSDAHKRTYRGRPGICCHAIF